MLLLAISLAMCVATKVRDKLQSVTAPLSPYHYKLSRYDLTFIKYLLVLVKFKFKELCS